MPYLVQGTGRDGAIAHDHVGAKAAVDDAVSMMGQGMTDVQIVDPNGRVHRSSEFHLLLNEHGRFDAPGIK